MGGSMADVIKAAKEAGLKPERRKKESGPPQPDAEALQLTGMAATPYEMEMRAHRDMLRNVIEDHREGYGTYTVEPEDPDELVLEEEIVYPPIAALRAPCAKRRRVLWLACIAQGVHAVDSCEQRVDSASCV